LYEINKQTSKDKMDDGLTLKLVTPVDLAPVGVPGIASKILYRDSPASSIQHFSIAN